MVFDQAEQRSVHPSPRQGVASLLLALVFIFAWAAPEFWPRSVHGRLSDAIRVEIVVIMSFMVFALLAVQKTERTWHRVLKWGLALAYSSGFVLVVAKAGAGVAVLFEVVVLMYVTYGGILWRRPASGALAVAAVRWLFSFLSLWIWMAIVIGGYQGIFGRDEHVQLLVGALFFGTLGALDVMNGFARLTARFPREFGSSR